MYDPKSSRFSDEKVGYYSKTVEITDTGSIYASVYAHASDGHRLRRVGLNMYHPMLNILSLTENAAKKAHKWADEYMKMCERQEVQYKAKEKTSASL